MHLIHFYSLSEANTGVIELETLGQRLYILHFTKSSKRAKENFKIPLWNYHSITIIQQHLNTSTIFPHSEYAASSPDKLREISQAIRITI